MTGKYLNDRPWQPVIDYVHDIAVSESVGLPELKSAPVGVIHGWQRNSAQSWTCVSGIMKSMIVSIRLAMQARFLDDVATALTRLNHKPVMAAYDETQQLMAQLNEPERKRKNKSCGQVGRRR